MSAVCEVTAACPSDNPDWDQAPSHPALDQHHSLVAPDHLESPSEAAQDDEEALVHRARFLLCQSAIAANGRASQLGPTFYFRGKPQCDIATRFPPPLISIGAGKQSRVVGREALWWGMTEAGGAEEKGKVKEKCGTGGLWGNGLGGTKDGERQRGKVNGVGGRGVGEREGNGER